ncbi:MAG: hypothetical protein KGJ62_02775 [Armatimonadetes bacterium]|nr:hypothetical protein [Armatimonadota bacterium]MDE2205631.1 hypothetical protein [Armatimonadota bacterium]
MPNYRASGWLIAVCLALVLLPGAATAQALWTRRLDGGSGGDDIPAACRVDTAGDLVVTGTSYAGATAGLDILTVKYSSGGSILWQQRYNGAASMEDDGACLALDGANNVYVGGKTYTGDPASGGHGYDFVTVKYSSSGVRQWVRTYNGPGNGDDAVTAIAALPNGGVVVTGSSAGAAGGLNYETIGYNAAGVEIWQSRYTGPAGGADIPTAIAAGSDSSVVVTGYSVGTSTAEDFATIKYSANGTVLWKQRYDGSGHSTDEATCVALDGSGDAVVAGFSYGGTTTGYDYEIIKYSSAGSRLWAKRWNSASNSTDKAAAIAIDSSGNIDVTGSTYTSPARGFDIATLQLSPNGVTKWLNVYNSANNLDDKPTCIAVDAANNVLVAGYSDAGLQGFNTLAIKLTPTGQVRWKHRYNGAASADDVATAAAVDPATGDLYVASYSDGGPTAQYDYLLIKYGP